MPIVEAPRRPARTALESAYSRRGRAVSRRRPLRARLRPDPRGRDRAHPRDQGPRRRQALGGHVLLAAGDARAGRERSGRAPATRSARCCPGPVTLVVANPERRYPLACREDPERLGVRLIEGPLAGAACADLPDLGQPLGRAGARALRRRRPRDRRRASTWRSTAASSPGCRRRWST